MAKLECSIIIVSYYSNEPLIECLKALFAERSDDFHLEIIVVDNGNSSKIKDYLSQCAQKKIITWIHGHGNIGFAAGCNKGVSQALSDIICLLNPDCIVQKDALVTLRSHFLNDTANQKKVVSGWLTNSNGSEQRGLRRNVLSPWSLFVEMLPIVKRLPLFKRQRLNLTDQEVEGRLLNVGACSGACMMMNKSLYDSLQGMDETYFLHVEDLDFCKKVQDVNGKIMIDTDAVFSHYKSSSSASSKRVTLCKRDGFVYYFKKHHPVFWKTPLGWCLYVAIELNAKRNS